MFLALQVYLEKVLPGYHRYLDAERHLSRYTIRNYFNDLHSYFNFLSEQEITSLEEVDHALLDPMKSAISPKLQQRLPSFLSHEEARNLVEAPDLSTPQGLRDRAFLELLYASGLRVSELVGLDFSDINLTTRELRVLGKGSKERIVLMGEPAVQAVETYIEKGRPQLSDHARGQALFINRYGRRFSQRLVQLLVSKYGRLVGLTKKVHPHLLRHTFATHMLDGGADLRVVQELMGHTNLATTQVYTHVSQSQARKVYLTAHPLAKQPKE
ncbi:MAG: xerC [Dehalococcoidia bacterium]|nr:xerC [Dehalococcoidia bacterium]